MRRSILIHTILAVFTIFLTKPVQADDFAFSYVFSQAANGQIPVSASGLFTTTPLDPVNNIFTITGISGTRVFDGITQNITGLIAPGEYGGNNNLLFAMEPLLDNNGFSYTVNGTGNTDSNVNVFYDDFLGGYTENSDSSGVGTFTVSPVPESSYSFLLLLGLTSFAFAVRRHYARVDDIC